MNPPCLPTSLGTCFQEAAAQWQVSGWVGELAVHSRTRRHVDSGSSPVLERDVEGTLVQVGKQG